LVRFIDSSGYNVAFPTTPAPQITLLATAGINTAFRGVALALPYTVTPSAGLHGSISSTAAQVVAGGARPTFTVTPDPGYTAIVGGTCGGTLIGTTYTTNPVTVNCTVSATFTHVVTPAVVGGNGFISPLTPQTV